MSEKREHMVPKNTLIAAEQSKLQVVLYKGTDGPTKTDDFSEKSQTAFDPPPPPNFRKIMLRFSRQNCDKSAYVQYGGTVVYYMILFPMRCM